MYSSMMESICHMCPNKINIAKYGILMHIVYDYMIIWLYYYINMIIWSVNIRRRTSLLLKLLALLFKDWAGIDDRQWAHERQQRGKEVPTGCLHPRTQLVMESHALAMLPCLCTWSREVSEADWTRKGLHDSTSSIVICTFSSHVCCEHILHWERCSGSSIHAFWGHRSIALVTMTT